MIAKALLTEVRKAKGPIYVEAVNFNDACLVQVVKSDLIAMIQDKFIEDEETGFELSQCGVFGKDYVNGQ